MAHADPSPVSVVPSASHIATRVIGPLMLTAALFVLGALPVQTAAQSDCRTIDDFSKAKVGEFPPDWKLRKEYEWDLSAYPMLVWSWRPLEFPKGADERNSSTNDSALAVYMLVPYSRVRGPKAVKYIWSEKVPVGTRLDSNMGLTQVRVLRSGAPEKKGEWVEERVNVLDDYKKYFDMKEAPKPAGIAVLTDSDETQSSAQGDYANFRACRQ